MDTDHNKLVVARFDELGNTGGDLAELGSLCSPSMVNHALAPGRPPGLEGTREFLRSARRDVHGGRWVSSHVVAEQDMVVQFGSRELTWPGGSLLGFETPAGTATRDVAFAYRMVDGRIAESMGDPRRPLRADPTGRPPSLRTRRSAVPEGLSAPKAPSELGTAVSRACGGHLPATGEAGSRRSNDACPVPYRPQACARRRGRRRRAHRGAGPGGRGRRAAAAERHPRLRHRHLLRRLHGHPVADRVLQPVPRGRDLQCRALLVRAGQRRRRAPGVLRRHRAHRPEPLYAQTAGTRSSTRSIPWPTSPGRAPTSSTAPPTRPSRPRSPTPWRPTTATTASR